MQTIVLILVLAITVEALIQYSKTIIEMLEKKQYKTFATQLTAILLSVFICFAAGSIYTPLWASLSRFRGWVCCSPVSSSPEVPIIPAISSKDCKTRTLGRSFWRT